MSRNGRSRRFVSCGAARRPAGGAVRRPRGGGDGPGCRRRRSPTSPMAASGSSAASSVGPMVACGSRTRTGTRSVAWTRRRRRSPSTRALASRSRRVSRSGPMARCGSRTQANNSIGRIDPSTHAVTNYTGTGIDHPTGYCGRTRRQHVVHERCRGRLDRHDRPDHACRRELHQWWLLRYRQSERDHRRARRQHVVHQRRQQLDRRDPHQRQRKHLQLVQRNRLQPAGHRGGFRRRAVVHERGQQLDRPDRHQREHHALHRSGNFVAGRYRGGVGRRVVVR